MLPAHSGPQAASRRRPPSAGPSGRLTRSRPSIGSADGRREPEQQQSFFGGNRIQLNAGPAGSGSSVTGLWRLSAGR